MELGETNRKPARAPNQYTDDDIANGVDGLYFAGIIPGVAKLHTIFVVGAGGTSKRKRRDVQGMLLPSII